MTTPELILVFQRRDNSELRVDCPRDLLDVVDAVSIARGTSRTDVVLDILAAWAEKEVHAASIVARVARRNPRYADRFGTSAG